MKQLIISAFVAASLAASPALAQEQSEPEPEFGDMARSLFDLLDELTKQVSPMMREFADDVTPLMEEFSKRFEGIRGYEAPEMLPNGDIIIRRKPEGENPAEDAAPEGQIEL